MRGGVRKKKTKDEVDQLLEAAQDEVMLKLSVDSHISAVSSDYIDPDLRRRFNSLRSRPSSGPSTDNPQQRIQRQQMPRSEDVGDTQDDLMARFAALKAFLPATSSSSRYFVSENPWDGDGEVEEEEDEVDKVIKWAMDAGRLDPSPESDDEDGNPSSNGEDNDDDDDDEHDKDGGSKKDGKQ